MNPYWTYLYNFFLVGFTPFSLLSKFPCLQDHFLLAAVNKEANNCCHCHAHSCHSDKYQEDLVSCYTKPYKGGTQTNTLIVRFSDMSHNSLELGAVTTPVCKHCGHNIRTGERKFFFFFLLLAF